VLYRLVQLHHRPRRQQRQGLVRTMSESGSKLPNDLGKVTPIFAAAFALIYLASVENNWALFTYHARTGQWGWLVQKGIQGPGMYWYGWLGTAFLGASAISLLSLPLVRRVNVPTWIGWAIPLATMFAFLYFLRGFFLR
jgi:hypothetical protein